MEEAFENTVGKGENAGNQHFLLFPQYFLLYYRKKSLATFKLSSANTSNFGHSKILSFGKELTFYQIILSFDDPGEEGF